MKKVTRKNLDELARSMPVISENLQRTFIGGMGESGGYNGKTYTMTEFYAMLDSGNWQGGYVEGLGYTGPEVNCSADGTIVNKFHGISAGYIVNSGGIGASIDYTGYMVINNGILNVSCSAFCLNNVNKIIGGSVHIYVNNSEIANKKFTLENPGGYIVDPANGSFLGEASFNIANYRGNVRIEVEIATGNDTGSGVLSGNKRIVIYNQNR